MRGVGVFGGCNRCVSYKRSQTKKRADSEEDIKIRVDNMNMSFYMPTELITGRHHVENSGKMAFAGKLPYSYGR